MKKLTGVEAASMDQVAASVHWPMAPGTAHAAASQGTGSMGSCQKLSSRDAALIEHYQRAHRPLRLASFLILQRVGTDAVDT